MDKLTMLFEIAEKNNICVEYVDFQKNIYGLYFKDDDIDPVIGINKKIISNTRLFTCVLAEELGHHFTTVGDCTAEYYCYGDKLIISKKETLAMKWATEMLLPIEEIVQVFQHHITEFYELADVLQVTEPFLLKRFKFIAARQQYIDIDDYTAICLSNLPNVFLYKKF